MKKNGKQRAPNVELQELREACFRLILVKVDLLARKENLESELNQIARAEMMERRRQKASGVSQSWPENLRVQITVALNESDQELRGINAKIFNAETKIIFLEGEASGLTKAAKAGATGRKNKYEAMKIPALEWYQKERHRFQNKDDAAFEITKTYPVEFSTARGWLKGV